MIVLPIGQKSTTGKETIEFSILGDKSLEITIFGPPIPKARPRFYFRGNKQHAYDTQYQEKTTISKTVAWHAGTKLRSMGFWHPDNSYALKFEFHMKYPCATSQRQEIIMQWGIGATPKKPDVDNLTKFYCDALNDITYPDDSQIVTIEAIKKYSLNPKTIINIMAIRPITIDDKTAQILECISPQDFCELTTAAGLISQMDTFPGGTDHNKIAGAIMQFAKTYSKVLNKIAKYEVYETS